MSTDGRLTLRPNVSKEEAMREFSGGGISARYWRMRRGPLRRIADVYVPYYVFHVEHSGVRPHLFAIDAVDGSLDLFEFHRVPRESEMQAIAGRNRLTAALSMDRATEILRDKALRIVFQQGFFKLRNLRLEITPVPCQLHLPYWLGFYGHDGSLHCRVMDAVRRRMEGAKASALFEQWLAA